MLVAVMVPAACSPAAPEGLDGFATATIEVSGEAWLVAVADTAELRRQGLRGVGDLGDLDGMLFEFADDTETSFTMRDTVMPIDIAFFSADGSLVSRLSMVPCTSATCPSYRAEAPFRWALETGAGGFGDLEPLTLSVPWMSILRSG